MQEVQLEMYIVCNTNLSAMMGVLHSIMAVAHHDKRKRANIVQTDNRSSSDIPEVSCSWLLISKGTEFHSTI